MLGRAMWKCLGVGILAGLAYVAGEIVSGILMGMLHVKMPDLLPAGVKPQQMMLASTLVLMFVGIALTPLAAGIGGKRASRWMTLFLLVFVILGVNGTLELRIFSTLLPAGAAVPLMASFLLPALFCSGVLAWLHATDDPEARHDSDEVHGYFAGRSTSAWVLRFALAIVAFPVCYLVFGMMVAPFVVPYYQKGVAGLLIPPMTIILQTQMVRSTLFLLISLPFLMLWRRSSLRLVLSLGMAHWALVGLFGLLLASWLPMELRVSHSLEIGADSFAYAAALVLLLRPTVPKSRVTSGAQMAAPVRS